MKISIITKIVCCFYFEAKHVLITSAFTQKSTASFALIITAATLTNTNFSNIDIETVYRVAAI